MKRNFARAVCIIMFDVDGNILTVTRRNTDILCLPGGKVDPGETPEQAIRREVKEETGITIPTSVVLYPIYGEIVYGSDNMDYYCETYFITEPFTCKLPFNGEFQYMTPLHTWQVEEGINVQMVGVEELLTKGDFVEYNTEALKKAVKFLTVYNGDKL